MPDKPQEDVEVLVPQERRHGPFANAFRLLPDGAEFLLDFLTYSEQESSAVLVARVRVCKGLLVAMKDRLARSLVEINPDGRKVFMAKGNTEVH